MAGEMNIAYLLLGSNLDDRFGLLEQARKAIASSIGSISGESAVYESEPWGFASENHFLNQVIMVETSLDPFQLIDMIYGIEQNLGRTRVPLEGYISRTIDIDILFFNDEIISSERLMIPHPKIQERMFTLLPLVELNGAFIHPAYNKSVGALKDECRDPLPVYLYQPKLL